MEFRSRLEHIVGIQPEAVARRDSLGHYHFERALPTLDALQLLCKRLLICDLAAVPPKLIHAANTRLDGLSGILQRITSFDPAQGSGGRDSLLRELDDAYGEVAETSIPVLSWDSSFAPDRAEAEARRALDESQRVLVEVKQAATEAQKTLGALRMAAAEGAIRKEAGYFERRARSHAQRSAFWFAMTVGTILAFACFAWFLWKHPYPADLGGVPESERAVAVVGFISARLVALAVMGYVLAWAGRNHRAHRHNEIVNRHRALALQTFEAFAESVKDDPHTRNAILMQAAQCAFSPQISGYMTGEPDPLPHNTVVEVLKSVGAPPSQRT